MPTLQLETFMEAPPDVCFDLSRSIDLHILSTQKTGERAIAGRTSGLLQLGETVTWRAQHFGFWQTLTSKITAFERPHFFVDEMVQGAFKSFRHEHHFTPRPGGGTLVKDVFTFASPLGILGTLANHLVLTKYMKRLLLERNQIIKEYAESGKAEAYLSETQ
ncbi:cell division protein [Nibribacter ruber]|uniref:Cell division protein n=2 Tax=Nibribacter ruber TaxID=2698458 RepID=A0A6P1P4I4_9BACT|nr:cell division protein [Nibribacter ruber]